jgi:hypothetical protein
VNEQYYDLQYFPIGDTPIGVPHPLNQLTISKFSTTYIIIVNKIYFPNSVTFTRSRWVFLKENRLEMHLKMPYNLLYSTSAITNISLFYLFIGNVCSFRKMVPNGVGFSGQMSTPEFLRVPSLTHYIFGFTITTCTKCRLKFINKPTSIQ